MSAASFHAVIVAAGEGKRLGRGRKAGFEIAGAPLVCWSLTTIAGHPGCATGVLVVHPDDLESAPVWLASAGADDWQVASGGQTRTDSSQAGIARLSEDAARFIVHDGARPALHRDDLDSLLAGISQEKAAILAEMQTDTLHRATADRLIDSSVERQGLWRAQTPQGFSARHRQALLDGAGASDEAGLALAAGIAVTVVEGNHPNPKLTRPADLPWIEALLRQRSGEPPAGRYP